MEPAERLHERRAPGRPDPEEIDARKAAAWAALAALAQIAIVFAGHQFYPYLQSFLLGPAYGLLLPAMAVLHVRHTEVRGSGAVLATLTGVAFALLGAIGSFNVDLRPAALFVLGMWWWTVGKLWTETAILPRPLGLATAAGGLVAVLLSAATAFEVIPEIVRAAPLPAPAIGTLQAAIRPWDLARIGLAVWLIGLAAGLLRR
jgi:hypothetical protein